MSRERVQGCRIGIDKTIGGCPPASPAPPAGAQGARQALVDFHQIARTALGFRTGRFQRRLQRCEMLVAKFFAKNGPNG